MRADDRRFALTPRVLELGMAYVQSLGLWDVARPHMEALVRRTGESSSIAQLDGSDIVYMARVAVPKIITLRVDDRHQIPALRPRRWARCCSRRFPCRRWTPCSASRAGAGVQARWRPDRAELDEVLREVRAKGWALTDEQLAPGHPVGRRAPAGRRRRGCSPR